MLLRVKLLDCEECSTSVILQVLRRPTTQAAAEVLMEATWIACTNAGCQQEGYLATSPICSRSQAHWLRPKWRATITRCIRPV